MLILMFVMMNFPTRIRRKYQNTDDSDRNENSSRLKIFSKDREEKNNLDRQQKHDGCFSEELVFFHLVEGKTILFSAGLH